MVRVALPPDLVRPIRREWYDRLVEMGAFENEHVELLYGNLVEMSPQGAAHRAVAAVLHKILVRELGDRAEIASHSPIIASDESEPEPDIAVVPPGNYFNELPRTAYLLVEVADSSLSMDRKLKAPLYAQMGVPEYWIVNLEESVIEVHTDPSDGVYRAVERKDRDAKLTLHAFPDVVVRAAELFPRG
jgi:Uma2 family endonuclease